MAEAVHWSVRRKTFPTISNETQEIEVRTSKLTCIEVRTSIIDSDQEMTSDGRESALYALQALEEVAVSRMS
jgi:hypothetical protein